MRGCIENIEDLKANRDEIISDIKEELGTEDMTIVKKVMQQMVCIVTASNYEILDLWAYEVIERACNDVRRDASFLTDNSEMYATASKNQLPSSMR